MKRFFLLFLISLFFYQIYAQIPNGYYDGTQGLEGETLREELRSIITSGHSQNDYDDLFYYYESTDNKGSNKVWDMYSMDANGNASYYFYFNNGQECGNYSQEGDCYNREHSVPKSWYGSGQPMYADLFIVVPTDGYVNGQRGNLPYGETNSPSWTSTNGSKKGSCSYPGYSGNIFEPIDDYKGDFARAYFYVATRYKNQISGWSGANFSGNNLSDWTINMLLEWDDIDPVSQKEIDRNNAVYDIQGNRNPYIDHPEFVECVFAGECDFLQFTSTPVNQAFVGVEYNYNITYETNNENETLTCQTKPGWLTFSKDESTNTALLNGTPNSSNVGNHNVVLQLSEDGNTVYQDFDITVTENQGTVTIFDIDFTECLPNGWSEYSVSSDEDWSCSSSNYLEINAYNSSEACNDWFISPSVDLDSYISEVLTFETWTQYSDDGIENPEVVLKYSNDYPGSGNPQNYTWNDLVYFYPQEDSQQWTPSGDVDLSQISGNAVYFAFQYLSSGTGANTSTYWKLDNIYMEGDISGYLNSNDDKNIFVYPNPTSGRIKILSEKFKIKNIFIYNPKGKVLNIFRNINNLNYDFFVNKPGLYFLKIETLNNVIWKKIIVR